MSYRVFKNPAEQAAYLSSDEFKNRLFDAARQNYEKDKPSEKVIAMVRNAKKNGQNAQTALDTVSYDAGFEPGSPQFKNLADFIKNEFAEPPYIYKKGDKVSFEKPHNQGYKDWKDPHEVIGFYDSGEVVDEYTGDPYGTSYGVRVKNLRTGQDFPVTANWLKRMEDK